MIGRHERSALHAGEGLHRGYGSSTGSAEAEPPTKRRVGQRRPCSGSVADPTKAIVLPARQVVPCRCVIDATGGVLFTLICTVATELAPWLSVTAT